MKKIFCLLAAALCAQFYLSAEIVSWKGMELGLSQNPKWIKVYRKKNDERLLRKKFDVLPSEKILVGVGKDFSLEGARQFSQNDALASLLADKNISSTKAAFLGDYWEEDDEKGYVVYSVYKY